jgi:hypothetical protein
MDSQGRIQFDAAVDRVDAEEPLEVQRPFQPDATGSEQQPYPEGPDETPTEVLASDDGSRASDTQAVTEVLSDLPPSIDDDTPEVLIDARRPQPEAETTVLDELRALQDDAEAEQRAHAAAASAALGRFGRDQDEREMRTDASGGTDLRDEAAHDEAFRVDAFSDDASGEHGFRDESAAGGEPAMPPAAAVPSPEDEFTQRRRTPLLRRLAVLGGADGAVLDHVPTETPRFVQMFFVLAGTALISGISMLFALITGVHIWAWGAVPLAIIWALIIFNLDRFLTASMKSTRNGWKLFGLAFPRVIMAALIGIVVAEPMVLQIFHNDIQREVTTTNLTQAQTDQDQLANGPEKQALDAAKQALADLQNQAATGIVAGTSNQPASVAAAQSTVDTLTAQMAAAQTVIDQARAIYQCELTGAGADSVTGCTGLPGQGSSSDAAKSQLEQAQAGYDALSAQLQEANAALSAAQTAGATEAATTEKMNRDEANAALPAAQATYDTALAAYNARAATVANGNADAEGLLSQISALNRLGEREPTLAWAHWLIAGLFFMIELLPVLVKVLTSWGNPSIYEEVERVVTRVKLDDVRADSEIARRAIAEKVRESRSVVRERARRGGEDLPASVTEELSVIR